MLIKSYTDQSQPFLTAINQPHLSEPQISLQIEASEIRLQVIMQMKLYFHIKWFWKMFLNLISYVKVHKTAWDMTLCHNVEADSEIKTEMSLSHYSLTDISFSWTFVWQTVANNIRMRTKHMHIIPAQTATVFVQIKARVLCLCVQLCIPFFCWCFFNLTVISCLSNWGSEDMSQVGSWIQEMKVQEGAIGGKIQYKLKQPVWSGGLYGRRQSAVPKLRSAGLVSPPNVQSTCKDQGEKYSIEVM